MMKRTFHLIERSMPLPVLLANITRRAERIKNIELWFMTECDRRLNEGVYSWIYPQLTRKAED